MTDLIQATQEDIERFMSYVDILPNGCWFWTGARSKGKGNRKWYGSFGLKINSKWVTIRAHRFSAEVLAKPPQPCPPGHHRDHTCVFSLCVCPEHIETISKEENHRRKLERAKERWQAVQVEAEL